MTSIGKLKAQARKHEQKEEWQKALDTYHRVLRTSEERGDEVELSLYNRIGDLHLRLGQQVEAVKCYEQAADRYAEAGLLNNAIALCNKALRYLPNHADLFLKLGRLSASQGFLTDARRWFLEFAEAKGDAGELEAAFRALEEFAALSEDPEIRELLANQLHAHGKTDEAVVQLRRAREARLAAGDAEAAEALEARIRELDPDVVFDTEPSGPSGSGEEAVPPDAGAATTDDLDVEGPAELPGLDVGPEPVEEAPTDLAGTGGIGLETTASAAGIDEDDAPTEAEAYGAIDLEPPAAVVSGDEDRTEEPEEPADAAGVDPLPLLDLDDLPGAGDEAPEESYGTDAPVLDDIEIGGLDIQTTADAAGIDDDGEDAIEPGDLEFTGPGFDDGGDEPAGAEEADPLPLLDLDGVEVPEPAAGSEEVEELALDAFPAGDEEVEALDAGEAQGVEEAESGAADAGELDALELMLADEDADAGVAEEAETSEPELPDPAAVAERARGLAAEGREEEAAAVLDDARGALVDAGRFGDAVAVVDELIRLRPDDVALHQERVEYAFRHGDDEGLVRAYLELGQVLERGGARIKARAVYQRVLDLDPDNDAARRALSGGDERRADAAGSDYVDLAGLLTEDEPDEGSTTRFVVAEATPTGDEERDFAEMLSQFKAKVSEHMAEEDTSSHYDLGLAFKEMGLIDEAIAEFQTALRGGRERLKVYEELGQCFMLKQQYNVAVKVLSRAAQLPAAEDGEQIGIFYLLGRCYEELGKRPEAKEAYERVMGLDIQFKDVQERIARL